MTQMECKMCGGKLEVVAGTRICRCDCCQSEVTLSTTTDDQVINMLNRANHFRQACEFDKAMEIYEKILLQVTEDPEVYWNIALCRYGIEYVKDPGDGRMVPTCHRTQFTSILKDTDYLEAIAHADEDRAQLYKKEATYIDNIQKSILMISKKEEPFDIFICYKETDENGKRTKDSALAQDLYFELQKSGFKVFFSRITLESKLGTEYEPYIFAALNSAKVMIVVGTQKEYYQATWVRNEWSRFLGMMKTDRNKMIIPAYRDMDPYDLPDELSRFQAQDMGKIAFMQDLTYGISKIIRPQSQQNTASQQNVQAVRMSTAHAVNARQTEDAIEKLLMTGNISAARDMLNKNITNLESYVYWAKVVMIALKDSTSTQENDTLVIDGINELMKCEKRQNTNEVTEAVRELMQFSGYNNCTVLHIVCFRHDYDKMVYCINHGANVNAVTSGGLSHREMIYKNSYPPQMAETVKAMDKYLLAHGCSDKAKHTVATANSQQGYEQSGDKILGGLLCLIFGFSSFSSLGAGVAGFIIPCIVIISSKRIQKSPKYSNAGKKMAKWGRVMSYIAIFFAIVGLIM